MKRFFYYSLCIIAILAICCCTRPSETAKVYTLAPFEKPCTKDLTLYGYKTTSKGKILTKGQTSALKRIIEKKSNYRSMDSSLKTPFAPHIAFELNENNKLKKTLLVGFNSEEWQMYSSDSLLFKSYYNCSKELLILGLSIFPNDKYLNTLYNTIK